MKGEDTYFPHSHYGKLGNMPHSWGRGDKNPCGEYIKLKTTCSPFPGPPLPSPWCATASSSSLLRTNPRPPQGKSTGHLRYWMSLSHGLSPGGVAGAQSSSTYCLAGLRPTPAGILLQLFPTFLPLFPSSFPTKSKVLNKWGSHASILSDFPIPIQSTNSVDSPAPREVSFEHSNSLLNPENLLLVPLIKQLFAKRYLLYCGCHFN